MLPFERGLPLPLPKEVLGKVYSFDATHREDYVLVMEELKIRFNEGLWWLSTIQTVNMNPDENMRQKSEYMVLPGSVCFIDYIATEDVCMQALNHEMLLDELLEIGSGPGN